jgi:hypothetical protein
MNERLVFISGECGQVGQTLGAGSFALKLPPVPHRLVYASFNSSVNDAGLTVMLQDDTVDALTAAVAFATAGTPGEWISTHFGGAETPVNIAGGSLIEFDFGGAAADTRCQYLLVFLV